MKSMGYEFSFYKKEDFEEIEELVLASYRWEYPIMGLSRLEFSAGLHPYFTGMERVWERTAGVYRENGKIVACAISEANDDGGVFFLFDSKENAQKEELIKEMLFFAKTTMSKGSEDHITREVFLRIPEWNETLKKIAEEKGFIKDGWMEKVNILPFSEEPYEVVLPEGYSFADGETTPAFYAANVHMAAFNYSMSSVKEGEKAFADLRKAKHYRPSLDLCILDSQKRPVAMAVIWYDERMPYCELEPLGVAWWERRKHLATAILHEAANRVRKMFPKCQGMLGGEQTFYEKIGYVQKAAVPVYKWKIEIYPSWDEKSKKRDYAKEL